MAAVVQSALLGSARARGGAPAARQHPQAGGLKASLIARQPRPQHRYALEVVAQAGKKSAQQKSKKTAPAAGEAKLEVQPLPDYETSNTCPCGSGNSYESCCEKFIYGDATPSTPVELMKSRYSAFAKRETKYIISTMHPEHNTLKGITETDMIQDIAATAKGCCFHKLAVIDTREGATPDEGIVQFRLWFKFVQWKGKKYTQDKDFKTMTETSTFKKLDGKWMYVSGQSDFTDMEVGDTRPLPSKDGPASGLKSLAEKAQALEEKAKEMFTQSSIADGMSKVFGGRK